MSQELSPSNSWLTIFLNYLNIPGHGQVEISLAERSNLLAKEVDESSHCLFYAIAHWPTHTGTHVLKAKLKAARDALAQACALLPPPRPLHNARRLEQAAADAASGTGRPASIASQALSCTFSAFRSIRTIGVRASLRKGVSYVSQDIKRNHDLYEEAWNYHTKTQGEYVFAAIANDPKRKEKQRSDHIVIINELLEYFGTMRLNCPHCGHDEDVVMQDA